MADEATETEQVESGEIEIEQEASGEGSAAIDIEALDEYQSRIEELTTELEQRERTIDRLEETVEKQSEQIEDLQGKFEDLSARAADGRDLGVCPECNGPTERKNRLFRSDTIECNRCGEVVYTY